MKEITFNELPDAVCQLFDKLENIERLLLLNNNQNVFKPDQWFDLNELCEYLPDKPAKGTAYGWVQKSLIPYHKKSKKLSFLKSEIDLWIKSGRRKTTAEISTEADNYLNPKRHK